MKLATIITLTTAVVVITSSFAPRRSANAFDDSTPEPQIIEVTEDIVVSSLHIRAHETYKVKDGVAIYASSWIAIEGSIIADGPPDLSRGGALILSSAGPIHIVGTVDADDGETGNVELYGEAGGGKGGGVTIAAPVVVVDGFMTAGSGGDGARDGRGGDGGDIAITTLSMTSTLTREQVDKLYRSQTLAGAGGDGGQTSQGREPQSGGKGGDIIAIPATPEILEAWGVDDTDKLWADKLIKASGIPTLAPPSSEETDDEVGPAPPHLYGAPVMGPCEEGAKGDDGANATAGPGGRGSPGSDGEPFGDWNGGNGGLGGAGGNGSPIPVRGLAGSDATDCCSPEPGYGRKGGDGGIGGSSRGGQGGAGGRGGHAFYHGGVYWGSGGNGGTGGTGGNSFAFPGGSGGDGGDGLPEGGPGGEGGLHGTCHPAFAGAGGPGGNGAPPGVPGWSGNSGPPPTIGADGSDGEWGSGCYS